MPSCVFHHPFPVEPGGRSGSSVRPYRMRRAFESIGYDVIDVTGRGAERRRRAAAALERIDAGEEVAFAYSETHTLPTLLTERHHLPTFPNLDHGFLAALKARGVPVGLFYRDLHWRFEQFRHAPLHQRLVSIPLFRYDWRRYRGFVDVLFLPSAAMAAHLPGPWPADRTMALPPGAPIVPSAAPEASRNDGDGPRLLYVGGVTPPLYDLTPLFAMLAANPHARLTLCTRASEWARHASAYAVPPNATVVHDTGEGLRRHFGEADLFAILWRPNPYLDFAMPVKLFEAIGHGLPIVTTSGTSTAEFVRANGVGWVVDQVAEFTGLLEAIAADRSQLDAVRDRVREVARDHTWEARAQTVARRLTSVRRVTR